MWLLLVSLLVAQGPAEGEPSTQESVTLKAETVFHDEATGVSTAEGSASALHSGLRASADRLIVDSKKRTLTAVGHASLSSGQLGTLLSVKAELIAAMFDENFQIREVFLLDGDARVGEQLELVGNHLERQQDGTWSAEQVSLIPCTCTQAQLGFSIEAAHVHIDPIAHRATVLWPIIRIWHVPIFAFPWLSLPLLNRQTGLLLSQPLTWNARNGFQLQQPVYFTLGESADITLTPTYFFGSTDASAPYGVRGPRLGAQFRYAPDQRLTGEVNAALLYDFNRERDPVNPSKFGEMPRGLRGELSWIHAQDTEAGLSLRLNLNHYSDGYLNQDLVTDVIAQNAMYLRSSAAIFQRADNHLLALDVVLRQSLETGHTWLGRSPESPLFSQGQFQRLPMLTFSLPKTILKGPLSVEAMVEAGRLAPLFSQTGDEGTAALGGAIGGETFLCSRARLSGILCENMMPATGRGDRLFQTGEREARTRAQTALHLMADGVILGRVSVSAFAATRLQANLGEASHVSALQGSLVLGARVSTRVEARFENLRHIVEPMLMVRALPVSLQSGPAYDEFDSAVASPRTLQGTLGLRQRFMNTERTLSAVLELGQFAQLLASSRGSLSESFLDANLTFRWLTVSALMRGVVGQGFTRVNAGAAFDDRRGHGVSLHYDRLLGEGNAYNSAPLDLLFEPRPRFTSRTLGQLLTGEMHYDFGPAALFYNALLLDSGDGLKLVQHTASVLVRPACNCLTISLSATQRPAAKGFLEVPEIVPTVSISGFGSFGK
jgi:LPS-assembly protein